MNYIEDHSNDAIKDPLDSLRQPFLRFLRIESSGGILLIIATIAALIVANSSLGGAYESFGKEILPLVLISFILQNQ